MPNSSEQSQRPCPNCGGMISTATIICPFCGLQVPPMAQSNPYNRFENRRMAASPSGGKAVWLGILMSNVFAFVIVLISRLIIGHNTSSTSSGIFIASDFTLVPLGMGIVAAYFWRNEDLSAVQTFGLSCAIGLVMTILGGAVFLQEGVICLLMASPLLFIVVWLGAILGKLIFPNSNNRLQISVLPLLTCLVIGDSLMPHHFENSETDTIVIHASPSQVWRHIPDFPKITETPDYWLFRLGLPAPMVSTTSGHYVGADRKCVFSHNAVFDEKIVEMEPNRKLTFDIVKQPNDPEIIGHLQIKRGQFILHDNGNGTTTVTGTTWYQLNVFPIWYYDWWTQDVVRHVHTRVMHQIKTVTEADQ